MFPGTMERKQLEQTNHSRQTPPAARNSRHSDQCRVASLFLVLLPFFWRSVLHELNAHENGRCALMQLRDALAKFDHLHCS